MSLLGSVVSCIPVPASTVKVSPCESASMLLPEALPAPVVADINLNALCAEEELAIVIVEPEVVISIPEPPANVSVSLVESACTVV